MMTGVPGTVYLLCFSQPVSHARHYLGWTRYLDARIAHHRAGSGSRLVAALMRAGGDFEVAVTAAGTGNDEQAAKRWHTGWVFCPLCCGTRAVPLLRPAELALARQERDRERELLRHRPAPDADLCAGPAA